MSDSPGAGSNGSTYRVVDWRHDTVLWSGADAASQWWNHELSDDLAAAYPVYPSPAPSPGSPQQWDVVMVKPDGSASTRSTLS